MRRILRPRRSRGQTLLLFALTTLFLALMVMMTLGIGMRVKENHEVQTLADAAAYSNAVATARAFNNISMLNRLQISHYVAMAADQSLISWTSVARAYVERGIQQTAAMCLQGCAPACDAEVSLRNQLQTVILQGTAWEDNDAAAAAESKLIHGNIFTLIEQAAGPNGLFQRLLDTVHPTVAPGAGQQDLSLNARVAALAGAQAGEISFVRNDIGAREVDCGTGNGFVEGAVGERTGACFFLTWGYNMMNAVGGTRRNAFLTGRNVMPPRVEQVFNAATAAAAAAGGVITFTTTAPVGAGSFGPTEENFAFVETPFSFAHDHGTVTVTSPGCAAPPAVPGVNLTVASSLLKSTADNFGEDQHLVNEAVPDTIAAPDVRHSSVRCIVCPAVWIPTFGFSPGISAGGVVLDAQARQEDANGQPKNYAVAVRDYGRRAFRDPWTIPLFRMDFDRNGQTTEFDNRGQFIESGGAGRLNIAQQVGMATGIAYYHRPSGNAALRWREYPNFLNPYWRATLVSADVDAAGTFGPSVSLPGGGRDISNTLNRLAPGQGAAQYHRDAYEKLMGQGYKGIH